MADKSIVAHCPVMNLPQDVYDRIADIHNSIRGHVGLKLCKRRFRKNNKQRVQNNLEPEEQIPDRMINEFLRQCPYCQITNRLRIPIKAHRFTCASYNPFEVLHLDHIGPLTKDAQVYDSCRDSICYTQSYRSIRKPQSHSYRPRTCFS